MEKPADEMRTLAAQLEAVAHWQMGIVCSNTPTGDMLLKAARYLKRAASVTCGGDVIGCYGGPDCTSDHK